MEVQDPSYSADSTSFLAAIVLSSHDAIEALTLDGNVIAWNKGSEELYGYNSNDIVGKSILTIYPEDRMAEFPPIMAKLKKGEYVEPFMTQRIQKNGTLINVAVSASPIKNNEGIIIGASVISRPVTWHKQATEQLESSNQELDAFTYSVAHDLRAPLRAIDGFSKILKEDYQDKLDAEGKRLITTICSNTEKMGKLIEDLLALSHTGRHEIKKENVNMMQLVDSIYKELIVTEPEREISLDLKKLPDNIADPSLMRQVWVNLISNAIKFTQTKQKALIEIGSSTDENNINQYYIKDNGIGFDMKYSDKLFGVFQRLHGSEIEGTGIGLAHVKRIIMRHGGKAWGEGKIDEGATFYFTLAKG